MSRPLPVSLTETRRQYFHVRLKYSRRNFKQQLKTINASPFGHVAIPFELADDSLEAVAGH